MNRRRRGRLPQAGFTLMEALISLAIFSFLGVGAYQLLSSTSKLKESGEIRYRELGALQLGLRLLEDDLSQLSIRAVRNGRGAPLPPLMSESETAKLEFTRAGWRNPLGLRRSRLQRVAWSLDEESNLKRTFWQSLDERGVDTAVTRLVAPGIESVEIRYLDAEGKWQQEWPQPEPPAPPGAPAGAERRDPLPVAIEVKLRQKRLGEVVRLVPVR